MLFIPGCEGGFDDAPGVCGCWFIEVVLFPMLLGVGGMLFGVCGILLGV